MTIAANEGDRSAQELDDDADREELRQRYYGLLQELRVLLPGVQILVAFMLTAPFAAGFSKLDTTGRNLYGVALTTGLLAVVALTTPTVLHRLGSRPARSERLQWSIRVTRVGLTLFGISLLSALTVIARLVYAPGATFVIVGSVTLAILALWVALPLTQVRRHPARRRR